MDAQMNPLNDILPVVLGYLTPNELFRVRGISKGYLETTYRIASRVSPVAHAYADWTQLQGVIFDIFAGKDYYLFHKHLQWFADCLGE